MSEHSKLQAKVLKIFQALGGYAINVVAASKDGVPDTIACLNGHFYAIECKVLPDKPSRLQKENLQQVGAAGGTPIVAYSIKDVLAYIEVSPP